MNDIFEEKNIKYLSYRISKLKSSSKPKWGKFNVNKMLCHLQDQLRYATGVFNEEKKLIKGPPVFLRSIVRLYIPWPKNSPTAPSMLQTKPDEIEKDKLLLFELLEQVREKKEQKDWPFHPFFGTLDGKGWARLIYRHIDYHLKQFGV